MPDLQATREKFIEQIGLVAQSEGMPRIAGRLMGLMIFDGIPYSFGDLAKELQVSRGSISSNARLLEDRGIIERMTRPGERQDYFQLAEDPFASALKQAATRTRKAGTVIGKTIDNLPDSANGTRARLETYRRFYVAISEGIEAAAERISD